MNVKLNPAYKSINKEEVLPVFVFEVYPSV
jgi:hypothetical protein